MGRIANRFSFDFGGGASMSGDLGPGGADILRGYNPPAPTAGIQPRPMYNGISYGDSSESLLVKPKAGSDQELNSIQEQTYSFGRAKLRENAANRQIQREELGVRREGIEKEYDLGLRSDATRRFEANTDRNYRMGSLGEERYRTNMNAAVENRKTDTSRELGMLERANDMTKHGDTMRWNREQLAANQTNAYLDRKQRLKEIEAEGKQRRAVAREDRTIQLQIAREEGANRLAQQQLVNMGSINDASTRSWGSILSSFLSR